MRRRWDREGHGPTFRYPPSSEELTSTHPNLATTAASRKVGRRGSRLSPGLPEHVPLGGHEKVLPYTRGWRVRVPAHDGQGYSAGLAHNQLGSSGKLIGDGEGARLHRVAVGVPLSPVVRDGVHARHTDGDVCDAVPPGPPKGVRDDDGNLDTEAVGERLAQARCGGVRVHGEQADGIITGDI